MKQCLDATVRSAESRPCHQIGRCFLPRFRYPIESSVGVTPLHLKGTDFDQRGFPHRHFLSLEYAKLSGLSPS